MIRIKARYLLWIFRAIPATDSDVFIPVFRLLLSSMTMSPLILHSRQLSESLLFCFFLFLT